MASTIRPQKRAPEVARRNNLTRRLIALTSRGNTRLTHEMKCTRNVDGVPLPRQSNTKPEQYSRDTRDEWNARTFVLSSYHPRLIHGNAPVASFGRGACPETAGSWQTHSSTGTPRLLFVHQKQPTRMNRSTETEMLPPADVRAGMMSNAPTV